MCLLSSDAGLQEILADTNTTFGIVLMFLFTMTPQGAKLNRLLFNYYQQLRQVFADEVIEVGFVSGADRLLILPLLRCKRPFHVHGFLQEGGQFGTQRVYRK